jgi:hypothetical protein
MNDDEGDILVFLTGQAEIEKAVEALEAFHRKLDYVDVRCQQVEGLMVLPLYAALDGEKQRKIFSPAPPHIRKVCTWTSQALNRRGAQRCACAPPSAPYIPCVATVAPPLPVAKLSLKETVLGLQ